MVFDSCFTEASSTRPVRVGPALSSPQAFWVSAQLAATPSRFIAALRSRSMFSPQASQTKTRWESSNSCTEPQHEQVLLED